MENKKDGSIFIDEKNKYFKNITDIVLKMNDRLNKLFTQIIYVIRVKEMAPIEALIEIDELITEYKEE